MTRREFTLRLFRADICPSSMDAIAVEVAWSGRYHRELPTMTHPALPHILLRVRSLEPSCYGLHS